MRKTIRVGVILLVLGLILTMFGIANNGIQSVYWDQGFHVVHHKTKHYHVSQIKDITIATANNVIIKQGTTTNVTVTAARTLPTITTDNGHVIVTSTSHNTKTVGFMFDNVGQFADTTTITVPKGTTVNRITAKTSQSGNITLQNITANHLQNLSTDSNVTLTDVKINRSLTLTGDNLRLTRTSAPSLQIDGDPDVNITDSRFTTNASKIITDEGDIHLTNNRFKTLKITTSDGDITLNNNHITENLVATTSDGDIHGTVSRTTGVRASTGDGDLHIFDHTQSDGSGYQVNQAAAVQYRLTTADGDITVTSN
ncbi:hypothetical protein EFP00_02305 [Lactiplantibacillus paraplantarum]|uniref:DUF4097 domain-containing protein n=1 Tax=Lactiplantibacillus paraplantarum TaxID=60520 RepID=UPI0021A54E56|nr:DUF4097 domain-containing protein [Lactiplantibacillus paraplantarum]MCT4456271.1 hypothetical protein [Lactiplantibacillus paraplantarum]